MKLTFFFFFFLSDRGWVGWKKTPERDMIEITFEFDSVREFHQVHIFTNNQFTRDVAVFKEAKIAFSIGGEIFNSEPELFEPLEDSIFEEPRNVSMKLHRRAAQFIKIQLFFASKWIMVSEISFESNVARGNYSVEVVDNEGEQAENENEVDGAVIKTDENGGGILPGQVQSGKSSSSSSAASGKSSTSETSTTSSSSSDEMALMPIVIGVLTAVILILAGIILFIVRRNRKKKWRNHQHHHQMADVNGTAAEKMALNNSSVEHPGYQFSTGFAGITMAPSDTTGSSTGSGKSSHGTPLQQPFPKLDDNYNTPHHIMTPRSLRGSSANNAGGTAVPMYTVSRNGSVHSHTATPVGSRKTLPPLPRLQVPPPPTTGPPMDEAVYTEPGPYTEPYRSMRYSPYYGYGPGISQIQDSLMKQQQQQGLMSGKAMIKKNLNCLHTSVSHSVILSELSSYFRPFYV